MNGRDKLRRESERGRYLYLSRGRDLGLAKGARLAEGLASTAGPERGRRRNELCLVAATCPCPRRRRYTPCETALLLLMLIPVTYTTTRPSLRERCGRKQGCERRAAMVERGRGIACCDAGLLGASPLARLPTYLPTFRDAPIGENLRSTVELIVISLACLTSSGIGQAHLARLRPRNGWGLGQHTPWVWVPSQAEPSQGEHWAEEGSAFGGGENAGSICIPSFVVVQGGRRTDAFLGQGALGRTPAHLFPFRRFYPGFDRRNISGSKRDWLTLTCGKLSEPSLSMRAEMADGTAARAWCWSGIWLVCLGIVSVGARESKAWEERVKRGEGARGLWLVLCCVRACGQAGV